MQNIHKRKQNKAFERKLGGIVGSFVMPPSALDSPTWYNNFKNVLRKKKGEGVQNNLK